VHLPRETGKIYVGGRDKLKADRIAHLPFERTFGSDKLPHFLGKDLLAKGYKDWVEKYGIVS